jgi:YesN/AraC family two-component response regulator
VEENLIDLNFPLEPLALEMDFSEKIKSLFEEMDEQYSTNGSFLQYSLACLLEEILLTIATIREKSNGYRVFKESIKHIRANFTEKIHIPFLAKLEGLSNSRYITLFRKEMGKTPSEYIRELRLAKACDLLLTTNMPISLVGNLSGYNDQYFFSKIFKKHIGTSPQIYRKNNKF